MKKIIYFIEFIVIRFFFILCKLLGYKFHQTLDFILVVRLVIYLEQKNQLFRILKNLKFQLIFPKINLQKMCWVIMEEF